ncbi:flagellar export chaperone FliS [Paenibacillus elgii]|uniref:flagellar export chaperone FliS n=1 Tax=Paenibacillus elgii TaxID=189691 RepID=UPI000FD6DC8F|nr:flagellar export chaperone FliS [Paenibacillus elgii]NEN85103.1 flagellar export chaperone FliS [Paenibacillus elgii]
MNNQAQNLYLKTQVNTAHPGELTLMLFNGCIKFTKQAGECIQQKNYEGKNNNIKRAIDIIDELMITLKMEYEISQNLFSLYQFMKDRLIKANIKLEVENIQLVLDMMTELRDTWVQALKEVKSGNTQVTV